MLYQKCSGSRNETWIELDSNQDNINHIFCPDCFTEKLDIISCVKVWSTNKIYALHRIYEVKSNIIFQVNDAQHQNIESKYLI